MFRTIYYPLFYVTSYILKLNGKLHGIYSVKHCIWHSFSRQIKNMYDNAMIVRLAYQPLKFYLRLS